MTLSKKFLALAGVLDERSRRLWAAVEAEAIGWGGVSLVARATGLSRTTISVGIGELRKASPKRGKRQDKPQGAFAGEAPALPEARGGRKFAALD